MSPRGVVYSNAISTWIFFFWLEILLFSQENELALHLDKNVAGQVKAEDRSQHYTYWSWLRGVALQPQALPETFEKDWFRSRLPNYFVDYPIIL